MATSAGSHKRNVTQVLSSHNGHAASTDATTKHITAAKSTARRNSEVSPQYVFIQAPATSNSTDLPFDARSILPDSKPQKSFSKLLEASSSSRKHSRSQTYSFQCIDGSARTYHHDSSTSLHNQGVISTSSQNHDRSLAPNMAATTHGPQKEQFKAFGIEAHPTRAVFNDICYDFVSYKRWCDYGSRCNRIHPLDKHTYREIKHARMAQGLIGGGNTLDTFLHEQRKEHAGGEADSHQTPLIRVRLPPGVASSDFLLTSPSNLCNALTSCTRPPPSLLNVKPQEEEVKHWDEGSGMRKVPWGDSSDTSSSANESDNEVSERRRAAHQRFWEVSTDPRAWYTDRDNTALPPRHRNSAGDCRNTNPSPSSASSAAASIPLPIRPLKHPKTDDISTPTHAVKHPRPKNNERCRNWNRNKCSLGYNCRYIHDDLEYDNDEPVVFKEPAKPTPPNASPSSAPSATPSIPLKIRPLNHPKADDTPTPTPAVKHPRPRNNGRCWKWDLNQCSLGYNCRYIHDDLEYDDEPVICKELSKPTPPTSSASSANSATPSIPRPLKHPNADDMPTPTSALKHPRPRSNGRCWKWDLNQCSLGYNCRFIHDDLEYDDDEPVIIKEPPKQPLPSVSTSSAPSVTPPIPLQMRPLRHPKADDTPPTPAVKHPRPRNNERCLKWHRNQCDLGYNCRFIHDDLQYDDDEPAICKEPPKPTPASARPVTFQVTLHNHMHLRFGPGFAVEEFTTGFESRWIFISNLPKEVTDKTLNRILQPFGEVIEIRRSNQPHLLGAVKVQFSKAAEAYKAFTTLHNTMHFGKTLESRMVIDTLAGGTFIKDTALRVDWDAPCRTIYMGYETEEQARKAVDMARYTPVGDFFAQASLFVGIPAVGKVTVRFVGVAADVQEEDMDIFGKHQGMVTTKANYKDHSVEDTIKGIRKLVGQCEVQVSEMEFRSPPYREGKMRVWAYFNTPQDAERAAEHLHGRKPACTGHTRITARHMKTISFSLAPHKFQKASAEIRAFSEQIWRQGGGYSLSVNDKQASITLRLCGENMKVLGRLKSELERMLNGEPVMENGKVAWSDFLSRGSGLAFLQELERQTPGVKIDKDLGRRTIRLFGVSEDRKRVRDRILREIAQLQLRKAYIIPLNPLISAYLMRGEYQSLQKQLGQDNVVLDLWRHLLRIHGDVKAFNVASDVVNAARLNHLKSQHNPPLPSTGNECPVCFNEGANPVRLVCGHAWCRGCLQRYLQASVELKFFPLTCLGNEAKCPERISLYAARDLLPTADLDAVVDAAFSAHVQTHPEEYHFCPTPDCPQVYRPAPQGVFIQCPSCLVRICPNCHTDAHDGLSCIESKHGDDLFRNWADKHDVKSCPGCNMAIEKDEGCNHMMCTVCKTHICWVCLATFPNGDGIYGHMISEHGDFGLGPIV